MYRRRIIHIVVVLWVCVLQLLAQPMFRTVDSRIGLPDNLVRAITTDSRGYVWMATQADLTRYDGYTFRTYALHGTDGTLYKNVARVSQDASGQIWAATLSGPIFCYDTATDTFLDDAPRRLARLGIKEKATSLTVDADGNLWSVSGCRLYYYVFSRRRLFTATLAARPVAIACRQGRAYALTAAGQLLRLDMTSGHHTLLARHAGTGDNTSLYMAVSGQLYLFDPYKPGLYTLAYSSAPVLSRLSSLTVTALSSDRQGRLWMATNSDGVRSRSADGVVQTIVHSDADKYSLPSNHISTLHISADGVLWVGTSTAGVAIANVANAGIVRIATPCNADIGCFAEDARGQLWIGYDGAGLLNASTRQLRDTTNSTLASPLVIGAHYESSDKSIYLGTYGGGIYRLGPDGTLERQHAACRLIDYSRRVVTDRHGNQWVTANNDGFCCFAPDGRVTQYTMRNSVLRTNAITDMVYDAEADQLVVSTGTGLYMVECRNRHITSVGDAQVGKAMVRVVCIDRQRRRWISTVDSVYVFSPSYRPLCTLALKNVLAIVCDLRGDLWATTPDAIYRLSPHHLPQIAVQRYAAADGMGDITFYKKSLYCMRNGNILAGGYGSYVRIQPQMLSPTIAHRLVLTRLAVDGSELVADSAMRSIIRVPHGEELELSVSDLDFTHASPSCYAYRIDQEGPWIPMPTNTVQVSGLSSGNHTIEVDLVGGSDASRLTLHVHVAVSAWFSVYAVIGYVAVIVVLVFIVLRFVRRRKTDGNTEEMKENAVTSTPTETATSDNGAMSEFVARATAVVESHLADNDFSVEQFSEEMLHSRSALYKKLMAATGKSPLDFIRSIRLAHGLRLLQQTDMPVAHIAYKTGLSPKQFSKLFKEEYGVLPSQWRKEANGGK